MLGYDQNDDDGKSLFGYIVNFWHIRYICTDLMYALPIQFAFRENWWCVFVCVCGWIRAAGPRLVHMQGWTKHQTANNKNARIKCETLDSGPIAFSKGKPIRWNKKWKEEEKQQQISITYTHGLPHAYIWSSILEFRGIYFLVKFLLICQALAKYPQSCYTYVLRCVYLFRMYGRQMTLSENFEIAINMINLSNEFVHVQMRIE